MLGEGQPVGISFHDRLGQEFGDSDDNFESSDDQNNITGVYDAPDQETDGLTREFDHASNSNVIENEVEGQTHADSVEVEKFDPTFENNQETVVPYVEELVVIKPSVDEQVELRRSTRERKPVSRYIPSMSGSKYGYAVMQLSDEGIIFPEAHAIVQNEFDNSDPVIVATVMSQVSLKTQQSCGEKMPGVQQRLK